MKEISQYLDYTILKADTTKDMIVKICNEAKENNCASVCVNPYYVELAKSLLKGSQVKVCTVVGFPLGATTAEVKSYEASQAIQNGAEEIDMVINIGALKNKEYAVVYDDIRKVLNVCRDGKALLKVIIETCLLTDEEKENAAQIVAEVGADFVKTSTGFSTGGATMPDVKLIKAIVGNKVHIKASGGIRDFATACAMIEAGADRLGTSKLITKETVNDSKGRY